jgi:hypothetical protein
MSSGNAAVQQSQQDFNYLALELNLYISISIGSGTGLDIKNFPPDAKPERWLQGVRSRSPFNDRPSNFPFTILPPEEAS